MVTSTSRTGVKSIYVGFRLLQSLAMCRHPMSLKDLAVAANMTASKAHRYLVSLLRSGMVIQHTENRTYDLGPTSMKIGLAAIGRSSIIVQAIHTATAVRDMLGETTVLTVWGNRGPTVIHVENSLETIIATIRVGTVLPVIETAAGRVFAAFQAQSDVSPIVEQELQEYGRASDRRKQMPRDQFEAIVKEVRERRQAVIKDFHALGVSAVASPLMYPSGNLVAVLAAIGRSEEFTAGLHGSIAKNLCRAAAAFPVGRSIDLSATAFVTR